MAVGGRKPTELEKKLLVRYKRFKSIADIPETIQSSTLRKMKVYHRLRFASYMTVGCLFGSLLYAKFAEYVLKERQKKENPQKNTN